MARRDLSYKRDDLVSAVASAIGAVQYAPSDLYEPMEHQIPPEIRDPTDNHWGHWLLLAGRGAGKTFTGSNYVIQHLRELGPEARVGVMGPTNKAAKQVCAEGRSGIVSMFREEFSEENGGRWLRSVGEAFHRDGGYILFAGSENVDAWRGPSWTLLWVDEWAFCNQEAIDNAIMGLRDGEWPRVVATTTPRPIQRLRDLVADPDTRVSKATIYDNKHLPEFAIKQMEARYGDTRLGRQELLAEILTSVEGALWNLEKISENRVGEDDISVDDMHRVGIAIDPATSTNVSSDYTAITVGGMTSRGNRNDYYIFQAEDGKWGPNEWATKALMWYMEFGADVLIGEKNNGGDMVKAVLMNAYRDMRMSGMWHGPPPNIKLVHASRGKQTRAEPIAALDSQGYVHHVGVFERMEEQMSIFPVDKSENDDLVDSRVWLLTELADIRWMGRDFTFGAKDNLIDLSSSSIWARAG